MGVCETVRATGDEMALRRERPHTPTTCCAYDAGCLAQAANYGLKLTKLTSLGFIRLKPDTLDGRGNRMQTLSVDQTVIRRAGLSDAEGIARVHIASADDSLAPLAREWPASTSIDA